MAPKRKAPTAAAAAKVKVKKEELELEGPSLLPAERDALLKAVRAQPECLLATQGDLEAGADAEMQDWALLFSSSWTTRCIRDFRPTAALPLPSFREKIGAPEATRAYNEIGRRYPR